VSFRFVGLDVKPFLPLFELSDPELVRIGARRQVADDSSPGYPCRVTLEEARPGERLLLVNYEHQPALSPYRASHAIYVRETARSPYRKANTVPKLIRSRLLSLRAFDAAGMMVDADVVEGAKVELLIESLFAHEATEYLHAHFAKRGCFAASIERI
jgi:hypothetical protein